MMSPKRIRGFTLIELMIVITIISILAAVAYPGYQNSVRRARRADAQGDLMAFAAAMERRFTAANTYMDNATADIDGNGLGDTGTPVITTFLPTSPISGGGPVAYNLTIQAVPAPTVTTYTLRATPAPGPQALDGVLTLTSAGQRWWDRNNNGAVDAGENTWNQ